MLRLFFFLFFFFLQRTSCVKTAWIASMWQTGAKTEVKCKGNAFCFAFFYYILSNWFLKQEQLSESLRGWERFSTQRELMNIREPGGQIPGKMHWNANKPNWLHWRVQKHQIRVHATNCPTAPLNTTPPAPPHPQFREGNIFWRKFYADTWKLNPEPGKESALHAKETPLLPAVSLRCTCPSTTH